MASHRSSSTARGEFTELQTLMLEWYGVDATELNLDIAKPATRIHVIEAGEGDPVVLVQGGSDEAMIWAPRLARLQGAFSLNAPDRPGHGRDWEGHLGGALSSEVMGSTYG